MNGRRGYAAVKPQSSVLASLVVHAPDQAAATASAIAVRESALPAAKTAKKAGRVTKAKATRKTANKAPSRPNDAPPTL